MVIVVDEYGGTAGAITVEDKVSVTAYVSDDANQNDIHAVMKTIEGMSGVQSVSIAVNADSLATGFIDAVGTLSREDSIFCDLRLFRLVAVLCV